MAFDFATFGADKPQTTGTPSPVRPATNGFDFNTFGSTTPQTTVTHSQPLDASTLATQATFPATGNEGLIGITGKTIGNLPSSAIHFAKGVFDFLNPANTVSTIRQIPEAFSSAVQANQGNVAKTVWTAYKSAIPQFGQQGDMGQVAKTVVPQFIQHTLQGDYQRAAATLENDPVGQIAPLIMLAKGAADQAGKGAQFDAAISKIASPVTVPGEAVKRGVVSATRFGASQLTGLMPDTISQILENPRQFSRAAEAEINRPALAQTIADAIKSRQSALSETGQGYAGVRALDQSVPVNPDFLTNLIKETTGLAVEDGKLKTSGSAAIRNPSDVSALQNKIYNVWQPEFAKGYITPDQFLKFRTDLGRMAKYEGGVGRSPDLQNLSSIMRGKANTEIRPSIPNLESLDTTFAPLIQELRDLGKGLIDKQGNLTDAAINKIANATGKGKDPLLSRLETLTPGITQKIQLLKAVESLQNTRELKPGTYTRAGVLVGGIVTLNPYLIISAIASIPEVAVPLLRGLGYSSEAIGNVLGLLKSAGVYVATYDVGKSLENAPGLSLKDVTRYPQSQNTTTAAKTKKMTGPQSSADIRPNTTIPTPAVKELYTEALKYKSPEEFVKAQLSKQSEGIVYHGGRDIGDKGTLTFGNSGRVGSGQDAGAIFLTPSRKYANGYVKSGGALYKADINLATEKIFDATKPSDLAKLEKIVGADSVNLIKDSVSKGAADWATLSQYLDELQQAGFTGAKFLERPGENITSQIDGSFKISGAPVYSYGIFKEVPVTKVMDGNQLIDIWKKAHSGGTTQ